MSHTLSASGVFMGAPLNESGDLLPPQAMYDACRVLARYVAWKGGLEWDWSALHTMEIPEEFTDLIQPLSHFSPAKPFGAQRLEDSRDDPGLPVDRAAVSGHQVHLLDPRPARLHRGRAPHRRFDDFGIPTRPRTTCACGAPSPGNTSTIWSRPRPSQPTGSRSASRTSC